MALTERELLEPVSDFIFTATGQRPYPSKVGINIPSSDFISMDIVSVDPISWAPSSEEFPSDTSIPVFKTHYYLMVRVTSYGDTAFSKMSDITAGLRNRYVRASLVGSLSYYGHSEVRDASIPINNTSIEKRYTTLIKFGFTEVQENPAGAENYIETVDAATFVGDYTNC